MGTTLAGAIAQGLHSARPTADAAHEGYLFFETDTNGGTLFQCKASAWVQLAPGVSAGGSGTVTSVAATVPSDLAVAGSPITTSGTLAITRNAQSGNKALISPADGSSAAPAFRALAAADIPSLAAAKITSGQLAQAQGGTGIDTSAATDGQILIGKTSDHSLNLVTLTAGTNITITNGAGSITIAASGGGGGTTLLAAVGGTDGTTASPSAGYASFGTAWSVSITTSATQDIIIDVTYSLSDSGNSYMHLGIFRGATLIYNSAPLVPGSGAPVSQCAGGTLRFVDRAVAAGTYTYEVKAGSWTSDTLTLHNTVLTTPGFSSVANSKGPSMLVISAGANV